MQKNSTKPVYFLTYAAAIAAIYMVLTIVFAPISFGPIQARISEALCILPYFTPAAIPGVFIGCLLSNLLYGSVPMDVIFGSLATLIGAVGSYALRDKKWLVCIPPILSNTIIVPWVLRYAYGEAQLIFILMLTVGIGEVIAVGVLGNILLVSLEKYRHIIFRRNLIS